MDVDPPTSSSRLSVLCSTSTATEYSSNSSEGSSPNSRRSSMNENIIKDESYWERRRKNNDASRRSREKRRLGDLAMEQKLLQLSQENERLKTQLESRGPAKITVAAPPPQEIKAPALPSSALASALGLPPSTLPSLPLSTAALPSISNPVTLPSLLPPAQQIPMLQLAQLAAIQQQVGSSHGHPDGVSLMLPDGEPAAAVHGYQASLRPSCVFSTGSAFVPFQKESVIMRTERISPDSSSDRQEPPPIRSTAVIRRVPSPSRQDVIRQREPSQQAAPQPSLLGALLSTRRPSPTVPQSRTEHLGLGSPPRGSKSDCESISSSASFSPSHSSEDQMELNDPALRQALGDGEKGGNQYMDRRRRNNEAAKRCRANRRAVFEYRSRRVQMLESENEHLKEEIDRLKKELEQQRALLSTISREGGI